MPLLITVSSDWNKAKVFHIRVLNQHAQLDPSLADNSCLDVVPLSNTSQVCSSRACWLSLSNLQSSPSCPTVFILYLYCASQSVRSLVTMEDTALLPCWTNSLTSSHGCNPPTPHFQRTPGFVVKIHFFWGVMTQIKQNSGQEDDSAGKGIAAKPEDLISIPGAQIVGKKVVS